MRSTGVKGSGCFQPLRVDRLAVVVAVEQHRARRARNRQLAVDERIAGRLEQLGREPAPFRASAQVLGVPPDVRRDRPRRWGSTAAPAARLTSRCWFCCTHPPTLRAQRDRRLRGRRGASAQSAHSRGPTTVDAIIGTPPAPAPRSRRQIKFVIGPDELVGWKGAVGNSQKRPENQRYIALLYRVVQAA